MAVRQSGYSIRWISNPCKEVQLAAVKDGYSIRWIYDPEIIIQYLLQVCPDLLMDPECDLKDWNTEETNGS